MRGEEVEAEIIQYTPKENEYNFIVACALCAMVEAEGENRLADWYEQYKEDK